MQNAPGSKSGRIRLIILIGLLGIAAAGAWVIWSERGQSSRGGFQSYLSPDKVGEIFDLPATQQDAAFCQADFAVIGDFGLAGPDEAAVAARVKSWQPDFIVTTGDNNYPNGEAGTIDENIGQYYHEYIQPYGGNFGEGAQVNRFFPSLGNHDWHTAEAKPYLDYFTLPGNERYYDILWGPVHLFFLDSSSTEPDGITATSQQAEWLKEALAQSRAPWQLVILHHPPYSSGGTHGSSAMLQWPYNEWGVDAVLAGHDHLYERLEIEGLPYFVNGLGGNKRYGFADPLPQSKVRFSEEFGAMRVLASLDSIIFSFVTADNDVIDTFEISQEDAAGTCGPIP